MDPFKDVIFKDARSAPDSRWRKLQALGEKIKGCASILSEDEQNQFIALCDGDTLQGLQMMFYYIVALEISWRSGEVTDYLITSFLNRKNTVLAYIQDELFITQYLVKPDKEGESR